MSTRVDFMKALEAMQHWDHGTGELVVPVEDLRALLSGDGAYRVVPVEPTNEMMKAVIAEIGDEPANLEMARDLYKAMIATEQGE